jgi:hypothetical protein
VVKFQAFQLIESLIPNPWLICSGRVGGDRNLQGLQDFDDNTETVILEIGDGKCHNRVESLIENIQPGSYF